MISIANFPGDILDVGISIKGQEPCSFCVADKDLLRDGLTLELRDSSYKIAKFILTYTNDARDLIQTEIKGSKISSKRAKFLRNLKPGDVISLNCIELRINDHTALSTTMLIVIQ
jgi:hypothetical protein